jgi:hypothetical protein
LTVDHHMALQRDPDAAMRIRIHEVWAGAFVSRVTKQLGEGKDEEAKAQFALALQRGPHLCP